MIQDESPSINKPDKTWNHKAPVIFSPVFDWPPKPLDALNSLTKKWVTVTRNTLFLIMAACTYNYFLPQLSDMKTLSLDWILPMFLRNAAFLVLVAGGLHLFFFTLRMQGKKLKFDKRKELEKSKKFTFRNQLHDNIFWSIVGGVSVWTCYEALYFWAVANEVVPTLSFSEHPVAFFAWLVILPVYASSHFYWIHRLLHWPPLFQRVHRLHHLNIHIGPWSGLSMHPVEQVIYMSSVLIHFVIASHPVIFLLQLYTRCMGPAFSHSGFEKLLVKDKSITDSADFHHQLHHKYFECNYGTLDTPWDRWFGSVHDGSDEATKRVQERRRMMYKNRKQNVS
ncbi:MAG: sterol desaturase family protein [Gammaproteobacteria bacterium]|nr:sterol desaturase family protein [Gammaproteobacteria bacterium]